MLGSLILGGGAMVLLRRVLGDALRARRQSQRRTLREVSTAANVSLGYLSEIERGQKEASSELLGSICDALGARLSDVLTEVSRTVALAEEMEGVLAPVTSGAPGATAAGRPTAPAAGTPHDSATRTPAARPPRTAPLLPAAPAALAQPQPRVVDGQVSVTVRHDSPLRTTLRATRRRSTGTPRENVYAA
jgi:transcriptional regulator with XRE-family HTH domain